MIPAGASRSEKPSQLIRDPSCGDDQGGNMVVDIEIYRRKSWRFMIRNEFRSQPIRAKNNGDVRESDPHALSQAR
ncbi:hypothetical protein SLE2022_364900 [Rubroshorea leprosula]